MKPFTIVLILLAFACKKENAPAPPVSSGAKVTVESASVVNHSGVDYLDVKIMFENSSGVDAAKLIVYKTDVSGISYQYTINL